MPTITNEVSRGIVSLPGAPEHVNGCARCCIGSFCRRKGGIAIFTPPLLPATANLPAMAREVFVHRTPKYFTTTTTGFGNAQFNGAFNLLRNSNHNSNWQIVFFNPPGETPGNFTSITFSQAQGIEEAIHCVFYWRDNVNYETQTFVIQNDLTLFNSFENFTALTLTFESSDEGTIAGGSTGPASNGHPNSITLTFGAEDLTSSVVTYTKFDGAYNVLATLPMTYADINLYTDLDGVEKFLQGWKSDPFSGTNQRMITNCLAEVSGYLVASFFVIIDSTGQRIAFEGSSFDTAGGGSHMIDTTHTHAP